MPRKSGALLIGVLLLVTACGDREGGPAATESVGAAGPSDPSVSGAGPSVGAEGAADDPTGAVACARLTAALEAGSLMTPGIVEGIANSTRTVDAPLADAAQRLEDAFEAAIVAKGKADEPDAVAAVAAAASDMSDVCAKSGLRTGG